MQVTREDLNPCTVKLNVVCEASEVDEGFAKALKQIAKKVKLPGFRPGHAPKAMVEGLIAKEELYETAAEAIIRNTFKQAMADEKIQPDPTTRPQVDLKVLDQDTHAAEYTVKIPLPPQVKLGEYHGLPVEKPAVEVTEQEVDYQIDEFRKRSSTREKVSDRGVVESDIAVVNIKPEGEEGEGRNFMTMVGQTFPELDQVLLGMRLEEIKNVELTFPPNFQEKDWSSKTLNVQVTLTSLTAVKLPELNEEFAKSLKVETVEELRTRVHASLVNAKNNMIQEITSMRLIDALHERSEVFVSDNMWEDLANRRIGETIEEQKKQDKTIEQYAAENGMTVEQFQEAWKERAKTEVERALLIQKVYSEEKMQLNNEDLNRELLLMAQEYQVEPEEMFNMLKTNSALDELQFRAMSRKVSDFLLENADIKEVAEV